MPLPMKEMLSKRRKDAVKMRTLRLAMPQTIKLTMLDAAGASSAEYLLRSSGKA